MTNIDFGGNAGLFLGVLCVFLNGICFGWSWFVGRAENGVKDGFGICD